MLVQTACRPKSILDLAECDAGRAFASRERLMLVSGLRFCDSLVGRKGLAATNRKIASLTPGPALQGGGRLMNRDPLFTITPTIAYQPLCAIWRHRSLTAALLLALLIPMQAHGQDAGGELIDAAKKGDVDALRSLINKGGNVNGKNASGRTPLMEAAYWGRVDAAKLFLEKGADPNAKDLEDHTPLIDAAGNGHIQVVLALLEKGADPKAKTKEGSTALIEAASNNRAEVLKALLEKNPGVEEKDKEGRTALILAAYWGHADAAQALIDKGANLNAKDKYGYSALMYAKSEKHAKVVDLLGKAGAK
jgi:ankyrin repeat protein